MASIRLRRLSADYEKVIDVFWNNPYVKVETLAGNPPYKYLITFNVKGLAPGSTGPIVKNQHKVEIYLPDEYPRGLPICKMITPHFHPNIFSSNNIICLGKGAASEGLLDLIIRIGRMIQLQNYNLDSPANSNARDWVAKNMDKLPIDKKNIGEITELKIVFSPHEKIINDEDIDIKLS